VPNGSWVVDLGIGIDGVRSQDEKSKLGSRGRRLTPEFWPSLADTRHLKPGLGMGDELNIYSNLKIQKSKRRIA
jgi:hypothetical protein